MAEKQIGVRLLKDHTGLLLILKGGGTGRDFSSVTHSKAYRSKRSKIAGDLG